MNANSARAVDLSRGSAVTGPFFNHAGASPLAATTIEQIVDHLRCEASIGAMEAGAAVVERIELGRALAARLFGADPADIAFTGSNSAGWGAAFAAHPPLRTGDRIFVSRQEWAGNLANIRIAADRLGIEPEVIPWRADGSVDADALSQRVDERVKLIAVTWLPANGGLINDVAGIGAVARRIGATYFVDAAQAAGQIPIDVQAIGCDVLTAAGRKYLRGPRGTGLLYVSEAYRDRVRPVVFDVQSAPWGTAGPEPRSDARIFEAAEFSVASILGLANAIGDALDYGAGRIRARIDTLATRLRKRLSAIGGVTLHDLGTSQSGLVTFTLAGHSASAVRDALARRGITVGVNGAAYTPIEMDARGLSAIVRASVSYVNEDADIELLAQAVKQIV